MIRLLIGLILIAAVACSQVPFKEHSPRGVATQLTAYQRSDIAKMCKNDFTEEVSQDQVSAYASMFATRDHRLWHYLWHGSRNGWHQMTENEKKFFLMIDPAWEVPHLMGKPAKVISDTNLQIYDPKFNGAGEDFLFMHHQMLITLQQTLKSQGQSCIAPWSELPAESDPAWPVTGSNEGVKSHKSYQRMKAWEAKFFDPDWLKGKQLGEVGYCLELSLHNNMHMRWASEQPPVGDRPEITEVGQESLTPFDDPKYDWLADPYSAHLNPHFWKLHGLIDLVIYAWLDANGKTDIKTKCDTSKASCYEWKGTWVGARPADHLPVSSSRKSMDLGDHAGFKDKIDNAISAFLAEPVGAGQDDFNKSAPRTGRPPGLTRKQKIKIIRDTFKLVQRKAPPTDGNLKSAVLDRIGGESRFDDPCEYVKDMRNK